MRALPVLPVMNAILPTVGGRISGIVLEPSLMKTVMRSGVGGEVYAAAVPPGSASIYQVGVVCKIIKVYLEPIYRDASSPEVAQGLFIELEGRLVARANSFSLSGYSLRAERLEPLNFKDLRPDYPVISGLGWSPLGGYTEARSPHDIEITVYGVGADGQEGVFISGNVGGIVSIEQAHTVEHSIIRSLRGYGLCSPRTLLTSWRQETGELKASLEAGFRYKAPELFGQTESGACGNPLTHLAHFYMAKEFWKGVGQGSNVVESLQSARLKTLSHISSDLEITSDAGLRILQGLKKGMQHTDEPTLEQTMRKVLNAFPVSPWE